MKWTEIRINTTEEACDAVSEMLTSIGAGGVAIEDPNDIRREVTRPDSLDYVDDEFLNALGDCVVIKAYFSGEINITELCTLIKEKLDFVSRFLDIGEGLAGYSEIDEEDWSTAWKKYYKPFHISDKVVIKPSWEEYQSTGDTIIVEIDPGMAFGTGTHETTRMCSQMLEQYLKAGDTVLDVGCGTGILSIIAAKLGASHITAVDIDEMAVRITKENSRLNGVDEHIEAFAGVLSDIEPQKVDVVVANIIANVIIDISKIIPYYLKAGGFFISSGIIRDRKQEVMDAYLNSGFIFQSIMEIGEWVAIVFKCQDSL